MGVKATSAVEADLSKAEYSAPTRNCDIVMKGGITSGVVYPHAVCELARTYRLRNVGGTSAGAIAAAATAAAEYGRTSERGGFEELAQLPGWIGSGRNLLSLFQAQAGTERLFGLLLAGLGAKKGRLGRLTRFALRSFPWQVALGTVPGIAIVVLSAVWHSFPDVIWGVAAGLILALVGSVAALAIVVYRALAREIPRNRLGLCSGMRGGDQTRPALTEWLDERLDAWAGRAPKTDRPLTFGDLWDGPEDRADESDSRSGRWLTLEMMTTNVTLRRPYRLPWDTEEYWFDESQLRSLFPKRVVDWMISNPPPLPESRAERQETELLRELLRPLRPLPAPRDLPVVVATRMSLSFPILLSAIPLLAVDWSREANQDAKRRYVTWLRDHRDDWDNGDEAARSAFAGQLRGPKAEICWFSDGGISSNFPVHFFDSPLPRWPTFGINLRPFHPDSPRDTDDEQKNSYLPMRPGGGILEWWYRSPETNSLSQLAWFLGGIARTMQNRVDEAQMRAPGYRDRVVHVGFDGDEGGMNLGMEKNVLDRLTLRGRFAARQLKHRYTTPQPPDEVSWDTHRWTRFRSTMCAIEETLTKFARGHAVSSEELAGPTYPELALRPADAPPTAYRFANQAQRGRAVQLASALAEQGEEAAEAEPNSSMCHGAPKPVPEARIVPRI